MSFLEFLFPDPPAGHAKGLLPMCENSIYQPAEYYLGSHILATSPEPGAVFLFRQLNALHRQPQIPAPNFHPANAGATNILGLNVQGNMGSTFLQLPPPPTNQHLPPIVLKVEQLPRSVPVLTFNAQLHHLQCCGSDIFYRWVCRTQHHARTTVWFSTHPCP